MFKPVEVLEVQGQNGPKFVVAEGQSPSNTVTGVDSHPNQFKIPENQIGHPAVAAELALAGGMIMLVAGFVYLTERIKHSSIKTPPQADQAIVNLHAVE